MAHQIPVLVDSSRTADADLSAKQYHWVKDTSTGIALCSGATDRPAGILQNAPLQGEAAEVMRLGISKAIAGAAIAAAAQVGTDAAGKTGTKVAGTDTTNYVGGAAIEAATAGDQIITVTVNCLSVHRAS